MNRKLLEECLAFIEGEAHAEDWKERKRLIPILRAAIVAMTCPSCGREGSSLEEIGRDGDMVIGRPCEDPWHYTPPTPEN